MTSSKPRLLLCGHTYGAGANLPKAVALSEWFDVMVCVPDFEGTIIMGRDGSWQEAQGPHAGYEHRRLRRWPRKSGFTRCFLRGLASCFREWRPEIVLVEAEPWSLMNWQCWWLARRFGKQCRFFQFSWENIRRPGLKGILLSGVYRLAAAASHGVICGNRGAEQFFLKAGVPQSRLLRTGQLGINPAEHSQPSPLEKQAWRAAHAISTSSFVIGFCGRFVEEKGILDLLEAVAGLWSQHSQVVLFLLGAGPLEEVLRERLTGSPWLRLLPPVTHQQVPHFLGQLDLFILPSKPQRDLSRGAVWEEQFGHVLIEAMAGGTPCLGSDSGAIPEVVEQEAAIFPAGDPEALQKLMERFLVTPGLLDTLGREQCERTIQRWNHRALALEYARLLTGDNNLCA
jgi:L-malate glycosyltransferase